MGLSAALAGLASAAEAAINAAGIPSQAGQCGIGFPQASELVTILQHDDPVTGNTTQQWLVSAFALPGGTSMPFPPDALAITTTTPTLTATIVGNVVTLAGAVSPGVPVHIGLNAGKADVAYVTQPGDTLTSIATALAPLVTAAGLPGVAGTAGVNTITVTGATSFDVVICGTGAIQYSVGWVEQRLQLSIWAANPTLRGLLEDAILANVGSTTWHSVLLADGTTMDCMLGGPGSWSDQSQGKYSLYVSHLFFLCEYAITRALTGVEIAALEATVTAATVPPLTSSGFTYGLTP